VLTETILGNPGVLFYEDEEGKPCVEYDRPSSLFGQFGKGKVTEVAAMRDRKLEQLVIARGNTGMDEPGTKTLSALFQDHRRYI
jgi:hypothetical protein